MNLTIDPRIQAAAPQLALGVLSATVQVHEHDADLQAELDRAVERLQQELEGVDLAALPQLQALRRLYRGLGKDPTRYRGSSEALLRRIVQGKGLYHINTVVDITNLTSIETRHSLGMFDLDRVEGDITFRPGAAGEVYRGIGRGAINLDGLPLFSDVLGPFGSLTSDSERTKITLETRRIWMVIIACSGRDRLDQQLERTANLLRRHASADGVELALYVQGRRVRD
jgi:DNA/RNA-binding domain of Phe-tRNA-synthetase-like protein